MRSLDELSREELYDLVWSETMATLAPKYGISDVALNKRCRRLGIPTPGRGYWAKVEAGQSPKRSKLPADIPLRPKYKRKTFPDSLVYFEVEGADYSSRRPHEVTVSTRQAIKNRHADYNGIVRTGSGAASVEVSNASIERTLWLLDQLLKSIERLGLTVALRKGYGGGVFVVRGREEAEIIIKERVRRFDNPDFDPKREYSILARNEVYLFKPGGMLRIKVKFSYASEVEWLDSATNHLDKQLDAIAAGIKEGLEVCIRNREVNRVAEIRREQERRAESERQRLREAEEERRRDLEKLAKSLAVSEQIHALAKAVESSLTDRSIDLGEEPIADWLQWARAHAERLDPVQRVVQDLEQQVQSQQEEA